MKLFKAAFQFTKFTTGRMIREAGLALDRRGSVITKDIGYLEPLSRHRHIMPIYDARPAIVDDAFIAPNATIIGEVYIPENTAIWYGVVIHGDVHPVRIGRNTSVGDNTVINTSFNLPIGVPGSVNVGNNVIIGTGVSLYSCTIDDNVVIGDKAVILEGARLERGCIVGPNTVVPPGRLIPAGQHWEGSPATFVREVSPKETELHTSEAKKLVETSELHNRELIISYGDTGTKHWE